MIKDHSYCFLIRGGSSSLVSRTPFDLPYLSPMLTKWRILDIVPHHFWCTFTWFSLGFLNLTGSMVRSTLLQVTGARQSGQRGSSTLHNLTPFDPSYQGLIFIKWIILDMNPNHFWCSLRWYQAYFMKMTGSSRTQAHLVNMMKNHEKMMIIKSIQDHSGDV